MMHKTFEFRLYPTKAQEDVLSRHFGHVRFVWNHFLRMKSDYYLQNKKTMSLNEMKKVLTQMKKEEQTWLYEANSQSLQESLVHLDGAYNRFFNKISKFPKFKKKGSRESFSVPQFIKVVGGKIFFPKFKEGIEMSGGRSIEGKICFATIKRMPSGKVFATITCEVENEHLPKTGEVVGIDLGLKDYAILSSGEKIPNNRFLMKSQRKLAHEQRILSKKKNKESSGYKNQKLKVARIHEKVRNQRKDNLHKISTNLIKNHDVICLETLNVKGMVKNHRLAKHIQDASWGEFVRMLEYKANWYGKTVVKIDRWFPSSKTCSECGWKKEDLKLQDRTWVCEECGCEHDRDVNASKNILKQGLNILSGCD